MSPYTPHLPRTAGITGAGGHHVGDLSGGALELHMSRSSPGRYASTSSRRTYTTSDITDAAGKRSAGRETRFRMPISGTWAAWAIRPRALRVFGDRLDVRTSPWTDARPHQHAVGADVGPGASRIAPITVRFEPPPGRAWKVATQLFPSDDPLVFHRANLQYLMDSPGGVQRALAPHIHRSRGARNPVFRIALHHEGVRAARRCEGCRIHVREARKVFGEFASFDTG
jgi:predicted metalloprotease with PDZ domain